MSQTLDVDGSTTRSRRDQITALLAGGGLEACRDTVLEEISTGPTGVAWCTDLAVAVMDAGDLRTTADLVDLLARATWGSTRRPARHADGHALTPPAAPPRQRLSAPKLRHDAEQFSLLRRRGQLGPEFDAVVADYRAIADRLAAHGDNHLTDLEGDDAARIDHVYNRIVHVADTPRVPCALSGSWSGAQVESEYLDHQPGIVVIDDFLSPEAWAGLIRFCQESTVWSGNKYADGRLGSLFFDGFNCPLLVQVAEEVRARFPRVVGNRHPLKQMWGFKNSPHLPADSTLHADFAAVNLNFWITPTAANLDPNSGGLVVYDAVAPLSWDFDAYNRRPDLIRRFLRERGARTTVVPYRGNRAIMFDSDLFHLTDGVHFVPDYEQRRVNITLLYGTRDRDDHHGGQPRAAGAGGPGGAAGAAWRSTSWRRPSR